MFQIQKMRMVLEIYHHIFGNISSYILKYTIIYFLRHAHLFFPFLGVIYCKL